MGSILKGYWALYKELRPSLMCLVPPATAWQSPRPRLAQAAVEAETDCVAAATQRHFCDGALSRARSQKRLSKLCINMKL